MAMAQINDFEQLEDLLKKSCSDNSKLIVTEIKNSGLNITQVMFDNQKEIIQLKNLTLPQKDALHKSFTLPRINTDNYTLNGTITVPVHILKSSIEKKTYNNINFG